MTIYQQGANIEREACKNAIRSGYLIAMRGAGSKCYSKNGKYKIDTIFIKKNEVVLVQHKKTGKISQQELENLIRLQKKLPNCKVMIGDKNGLKEVVKNG